jgi:zinc protease
MRLSLSRFARFCRGITLTSSLAAGILAGAAATARADDTPPLPFTKSTLPNGMTVILHEDHALPQVVVNVGVRTGSRMEQPHRTGFAHLFEHLMFMGTRRAPTKMFDLWMSAAGGENNAFTTSDITDYYDEGPPTALPLLLWLEADRLRDLGQLMTKAKLDAQRDVVLNERRQSHENQPYGKVELRLPELLYKEGHPYHHPVIGSPADLDAASVDDVKQFFSTWYDPANVTLVVAGDFEPARLLPLIQRDFGAIPSHGLPVDPGAPGFDDTRTTLTEVVRETIPDRVELPEIVMAWQSPRRFAPGDAELSLFAHVLASGKESRLYKSLVYEQKLAQTVSVSQDPSQLGSQFTVTVLARPGVSLDKLEAAIDAELTRATTGAKGKPATISEAELVRAKNENEMGMVDDLERLLGRAVTLASYQMTTGNPGYLPTDLARFRNATVDSVQRAATTTIDLNKRVILRVVPEPEPTPGAPAAPASAPAAGGAK